jgi:hypothetical protein
MRLVELQWSKSCLQKNPFQDCVRVRSVSCTTTKKRVIVGEPLTRHHTSFAEKVMHARVGQPEAVASVQRRRQVLKYFVLRTFVLRTFVLRSSSRQSTSQ